jgi:hypothetical protein
VRSALYQGWVTHKRFATDATGNVAHEFRYRTTMPLLFLDELSDVVSRHPRWSVTSPNVVWFRRRDFGGDVGLSLEDSIRDEVQRATGQRPSGRIAMLGHLRTWGFLFNPLTTFYVYEENGNDVAFVVLEVRSTPWLQRHRYVLRGNETKQRFAKQLHVSPFLGMDHEYVCSWASPGDHLSLHLGNRRGEERIFDAGLSLDRVTLDRASMGALVWRHPLMTYGVTYGIYREALKLWRKKAPFFSHPTKAK